MSSPASVPRDNAVTVRRKAVLPPMLRPRGGRSLAHFLRPEPVFHNACAMPEGLAGEPWRKLLERIDDSPFHSARDVQLYTDGQSAFAHMLEAVAAAETEVLVEAYILRDDVTGHEMMEALSAASRRGVRVKVLADAFGSSATRSEFWQRLEASGTRVQLFRKPRYMPQRLQPILDHRKLVIVDGVVGFTGGMNIADEYRHGVGGDRPWRDTHIRVAGDVARAMRVIFAEGWVAAGGDPLEIDLPEPESPDGARALLLDSRPGRGQSEVFSAFAAILGGARERVWISNAYFAPSRRMLRMLCQTAGRGVDVRLLLPSRYDLGFFRFIARGYYADLLRAGVRVFEYQPAIMHAKTLVADHTVSVVGSTNFDFRSFDFNAECNVLLDEAGLAGQLAEIFAQDLRESVEITDADWRRQPRWQRALWRLARGLAPLF